MIAHYRGGRTGRGAHAVSVGAQEQEAAGEAEGGLTATAQLPTPTRPTLRTRSRHLRRHLPSPKRRRPAGVRGMALPSGRPSSERLPQRIHELKTCEARAAVKAVMSASASVNARTGGRSEEKDGRGAAGGWAPEDGTDEDDACGRNGSESEHDCERKLQGTGGRRSSSAFGGRGGGSRAWEAHTRRRLTHLPPSRMQPPQTPMPPSSHRSRPGSTPSAALPRPLLPTRVRTTVSSR